MIHTKTSNLNYFKEGQEQVYINNIDTDIRNIVLGLQGRVRFGDGNDGQFGENMSGQFQRVTDTGVINTEFTVAHGLGSVPVGFLVVNIDKGAVIYASGTTWTSSSIYLKASVASCNVLLFVLK